MGCTFSEDLKVSVLFFRGMDGHTWAVQAGRWNPGLKLDQSTGLCGLGSIAVTDSPKLLAPETLGFCFITLDSTSLYQH